MSSQGVFTWPLRVYYEDTDAGGIVYYVNYLKFMERARTEWLRTLGWEQADLPWLFVVRRADTEYRQPARLDDYLQVKTEMASARGARLVFSQSVCRGQELLCQARVEVACVDRESLKPVRLPQDLLAALRGSAAVSL
ncbi:tol-pal system-associated acyl-CoA thioesterase [Marinospirillum perlucidum]|uniref:tol-pal system-associated acyl-CoA thioesterase n=1 Tax=Marinospirillum perlucidum TaxID=1982602 RepID=UPI000DF2A5E9|nr:tol-pal system-associated acyl-CoA thioesterase [Marinospirillum perlucidum]